MSQSRPLDPVVFARVDEYDTILRMRVRRAILCAKTRGRSPMTERQVIAGLLIKLKRDNAEIQECVPPSASSLK